MTKHFAKCAAKQNIPENELYRALEEIRSGKFEANLGGHIYKKRIRFEGKGKSGSGRTIVCYQKGDKAIYVHGFAKNEKEDRQNKNDGADAAQSNDELEQLLAQNGPSGPDRTVYSPFELSHILISRHALRFCALCARSE